MTSCRDDIFNDDFENILKDYLVETDEEAKTLIRDRITVICLPYVQKLARGLARRVNDPVDDLIQVGCLGLIKALEKFNPLTGSSFRNYATSLITGEIRHYLRDKAFIIKAPRNTYELYYRINQIVQLLTDEFGRTPTDLEIAEALECPINQVHAIKETDRRRNAVSLDQFIVSNSDGVPGNSEIMFIERLVDDKSSEFLQNQEDRLLLEQAMESLKEDLKIVVKMTYYDDLSQVEIADALGISQMQVSRRLRKALDMLYNILKHEHLDFV